MFIWIAILKNCDASKSPNNLGVSEDFSFKHTNSNASLNSLLFIGIKCR